MNGFGSAFQDVIHEAMSTSGPYSNRGSSLSTLLAQPPGTSGHAAEGMGGSQRKDEPREYRYNELIGG